MYWNTRRTGRISFNVWQKALESIGIHANMQNRWINTYTWMDTSRVLKRKYVKSRDGGQKLIICSTMESHCEANDQDKSDQNKWFNIQESHDWWPYFMDVAILTK
eukprot:517692_1